MNLSQRCNDIIENFQFLFGLVNLLNGNRRRTVGFGLVMVCFGFIVLYDYGMIFLY